MNDKRCLSSHGLSGARAVCPESGPSSSVELGKEVLGICSETLVSVMLFINAALSQDPWQE